MFYEEKVIGGVLYFRKTPDGPWVVKDGTFIIEAEAVQALRVVKMRLYSGDRLSFDDRRDLAKIMDHHLNNLTPVA